MEEYFKKAKDTDGILYGRLGVNNTAGVIFLTSDDGSGPQPKFIVISKQAYDPESREGRFLSKYKQTFNDNYINLTKCKFALFLEGQIRFGSYSNPVFNTENATKYMIIYDDKSHLFD